MKNWIDVIAIGLASSLLYMTGVIYKFLAAVKWTKLSFVCLGQSRLVMINLVSLEFKTLWQFSFQVLCSPSNQQPNDKEVAW